MVEPAEDEALDRLLRSGHDTLPVSYPPASRKITTRKKFLTTSSPRSPAFRQLGKSIARTDRKVVKQVRNDIGQLKNRTQKIHKEFEGARMRKIRAA